MSNNNEEITSKDEQVSKEIEKEQKIDGSHPSDTQINDAKCMVTASLVGDSLINPPIDITGTATVHAAQPPANVIEDVDDYNFRHDNNITYKNNSNFNDDDDDDNDEDYENLDLNFDDLYDEDICEEEFFVQQSPASVQYGRIDTANSISSVNAVPSGGTSVLGASALVTDSQRDKGTNKNKTDDYNRTQLACPSNAFPNPTTSHAATVNDEDDDHFATVSPYYEYYDDELPSKSRADKAGVKGTKTTAKRMNDDDDDDDEHDIEKSAGSYILGTLIVRIAAAKGLIPINSTNFNVNSGNATYNSNSSNKSNESNRRRHEKKRRGGGGGFRLFGGANDNSDEGYGTNPYVSVRYTTLMSSPSSDEGYYDNINGKQFNQQQVQRTSTVFNTCNPVWPRSENMYMDVAHPMPTKPTRKKVLTKQSSFQAKENESSRNCSSHPGDPPLKVATASAKAKASAIAKERLFDTKKKHGQSTPSIPVSKSILTPILSCAIFHSPIKTVNNGSNNDNKNMAFEMGSYPDHHNNKDFSEVKKYNNSTANSSCCSTSTGGTTIGDSDDFFLGMASLDVTPLLTGKVSMIDEWIPLTGGPIPSHSGALNTPAGGGTYRQQQIRVICEYEPTDSPPQKGDYVQFTQFCNPIDLYPMISIGNNGEAMYKVEEVYDGTENNDMEDPNFVLISHTCTSGNTEGWISSFIVHRNMLLVCKEREPNLIEYCQDEILSVKERITHSPLVHAVHETVRVRVPEDGLIPVSAEVVQNAISVVVNRWLQNENAVDVVVKDLNYITNWDGTNHVSTISTQRFGSMDVNNSAMMDNQQRFGYRSILDLDTNTYSSRSTNATQQQEQHNTGMTILETDVDYDDPLFAESTTPKVSLPNMPSCPITGVPMRDPVVAADGHTYERSAIARWLQSHDTSPLTGSRLAHKNLVPNYMLLSSLQEMLVSSSATTANLQQQQKLHEQATLAQTDTKHYHAENQQSTAEIAAVVPDNDINNVQKPDDGEPNSHPINTVLNSSVAQAGGGDDEEKYSTEDVNIND